MNLNTPVTWTLPRCSFCERSHVNLLMDLTTSRLLFLLGALGRGAVLACCGASTNLRLARTATSCFLLLHVHTLALMHGAVLARDRAIGGIPNLR